MAGTSRRQFLEDSMFATAAAIAVGTMSPAMGLAAKTESGSKSATKS